MAQTMAYKCPSCGGELEFESQSQQMACPYCGNKYDVDSLKKYDEILNQQEADDMKWDENAGKSWAEGEIDSMSVYICNGCGAEIVTDDATTAATFCPYCNSPVVLSGKFSGALKPDLVIPFALDKAAAVSALERHLKGKRLLPKAFKDQNHIEEVKGVYVPFWLFDTDSHGNINFEGRKVRSWRSGSYRYTETSHFAIHREGSVAFQGVPVDGSSKMPDDLMESVEPFDLSKAVNFQTAYLSGYLADKYDVTAEESVNRANARIKKSTEDAFKSTVTGFSSVTTKNSSVIFSNSKYKYALYPVWILNTTWNGERYLFAMNGQTGKFVGNLPMDKGAFLRWFGLSAGIAAVIAYIVINFWFFFFGG